MAALLTVLLMAAAAGFTGWAVDSGRAAYGIMLLPALAVGTGVMAWAVLAATPLGYTPGLDWLVWAVPVLLSVAATAAGVVLVGRRRTAADTARLTAALR
jgi:hypothetical protein